MQLACTRNIRKLAVGQVVYTALCYEHGGMLDDGTAFRLGPNNFRWIGGDEYDGKWLREIAEKRGLKVWVKSSTDQLHNIAVQGPNSREILKQVVWTPPGQPSLAELAWFHFAIARIGDWNGPAVVVSRTGYTGELGYEIFCHPKDALTVWDAVWEAGKPHGLAPLGLEALDMLRIEAGLIFFGYEFSDQTDPFEAGIGFTVALKGNEEFVGRDALLKRKESPQRVLVGLELAGGETAGHGDCVHQGARPSRRGDQRHEEPAAEEEHRALPHGCRLQRPRHRSRDRQARWPPETDPRQGRALPVLRSREDAGARLGRSAGLTRRQSSAFSSYRGDCAIDADTVVDWLARSCGRRETA